MKNVDCGQMHDASWAKNCMTCRALNERDKWRDIANRLCFGAENQIDDLRHGDDSLITNEYWLEAWRIYDEAVRNV